MLQIPDEVAKLFTQDSISKNFRVHFPNGEFRDLVNKDFVSESVIFTDAVSSDGKLKFGMAESPSIEFSTYFTEDINKLKIYCSIEIDISSLDEEIIEEYGQTSEDVPYVFYSVAYGYFLVNSCTFENTGICRVVAYASKLIDEKLQNLYNPDIADFTKLKLLLGALYYASEGTLKPADNPSAKLPVEELLSTYPFFPIKKRLINSYDEQSEVFSPSMFSPFISWHDSEKEFVDKPILKTFYLDPANSGVQRDYFIYVRGKRIVFDDTRADFYSHNDLGIPIGNLNNTTIISDDGSPMTTSKDLVNLPYRLSSDYSYELSWKNTTRKPRSSDFRYSELYEAIKDNLEYICSPCLIYKEISTRPSSVSFVCGSSSQDPQYIDWNRLFPTQCLYFDSREISYEPARYYIYNDFLHLDMSDPINKQSTLQNILSLNSVLTSDGRNSLNIFPKPLEFEEVVSGQAITEYNEALSDVDSINTWRRRPRHFEVGIPTEIVIVSTDTITPNNDYSFRHLPSAESPDVEFIKEIIPINDFESPLLQQYSTNVSEDFVVNTISLPLVNPYDSPSYVAYGFEMTTSSEFLSISTNPRPHMNLNNGHLSIAPYRLDFTELESLFSNYRILIDFAEINALLLKVDRHDFNSWKFIQVVQDTFILYPDEDIFPDENLFPSGIDWKNYILSSLWRRLQNSRYVKYPYNKVICKIGQDTYEATVVDVSDDDVSEYQQYDISNNWFITSGAVDVQQTLNFIADTLKAANYHILQMTMRGLPYIESGDILYVINKDSTIVVLSARQRIKGIQSLITDVENN